jgi:hypothetical protein
MQPEDDKHGFGGAARFSRACPTEECRQGQCAELRDADIEMLACIAARLAGQKPDRHITIRLGDVVAFDDVAWRYPDFLARAEAAYRILRAENDPD